MNFSPPLARLVDAFQRLPGIGPKSAQRLAFHVLKQPLEDAYHFSQTLIQARETIKPCAICFNWSSVSPCEVCTSEGRQHKMLCVVSEPRDVFALERTHSYNGLYHVLGGLLSPMDGVGPNELNLDALVKRLQPEAEKVSVNAPVTPSLPAMSVSAEAVTPPDSSGLTELKSFTDHSVNTLSGETSIETTGSTGIEEVILALPPSAEGDATSLYIGRLLKPLGIKASRIAFGLPVGGDLDYADSLTLSLALQGRQILN